MTPIQVIGIGLDGLSELSNPLQMLINQSSVIVGGVRHLSYLSPTQQANSIPLGNLKENITTIRQAWENGEKVVVLASGDPLFFGIGRLLVESFPHQALQFHPHVSSVQLAFSRVKVPWQDASIMSLHGRSLEGLSTVLQRGEAKIALLTDGINTPSAIAKYILSLALPWQYQLWVCENLGGKEEKVQCFSLETVSEADFSPLNIVILLRQDQEMLLNLDKLPLFGIEDRYFASFCDRPNLMTKREIRIAILGELALQKEQIIWDIGAGTGSVSIEMARLSPTSQIYALEKTAMGVNLIEQNCQRFQVQNVSILQKTAPQGLNELPNPHRVFIGGSGGNLEEILQVCVKKLQPDGLVVLAFATLDHLTLALNWFKARNKPVRLLQVQINQSVPVASLTRFSPLNPVTLLMSW